MSRVASGMHRWVGIAVACAVGAVGASSACTLELDLAISCGDGYVDEEAGEECDPAVLDSFEDACQGTDRPLGVARCDEVTCQIDNSIATCAACGDGFVDTIAGEECDGSDLGGNICDGDAGTLACTDHCQLDYRGCETCGNGIFDEGIEECDPKDTDRMDIGIERPCAGANFGTPDEIPPLASPGKPYTSGTTTVCTGDCTYNRIGCGYCGDGVIDTQYPVDLAGTPIAQPELCDGDAVPEDMLAAMEPFYTSQCAAAEAMANVDLRPNFTCNNACTGLVSHINDATCCVKGGEPCPQPGSDYQCCYAYAHPEEANACESPVLEGGNVGLPVCKPFSSSVG